MANKRAERNTQASPYINNSVYGKIANHYGRKLVDPERRNIYVDGKFRAQLHKDAAYPYADNEMRKGGSVFVTTLQYDVSEYMA